MTEQNEPTLHRRIAELESSAADMVLVLEEAERALASGVRAEQMPDQGANRPVHWVPRGTLARKAGMVIGLALIGFLIMEFARLGSLQSGESSRYRRLSADLRQLKNMVPATRKNIAAHRQALGLPVTTRPAAMTPTPVEKKIQRQLGPKASMARLAPRAVLAWFNVGLAACVLGEAGPAEKTHQQLTRLVRLSTTDVPVKTEYNNEPQEPQTSAAAIARATLTRRCASNGIGLP